MFAGDEEGVFGDVAETGLLSEGAFEEGAGVDVGFVAGAGVDGGEEFCELFEFGADDFVVIAAVGVAGDAAGVGL